jgi:hypothetical protein
LRPAFKPLLTVSGIGEILGTVRRHPARAQGYHEGDWWEKARGAGGLRSDLLTGRGADYPDTLDGSDSAPATDRLFVPAGHARRGCSSGP